MFAGQIGHVFHSSMVGVYSDIMAVEVRDEVNDAPYHSKRLQLGDRVISLSRSQRTSSVCHRVQ